MMTPSISLSFWRCPYSALESWMQWQRSLTAFYFSGEESMPARLICHSVQDRCVRLYLKYACRRGAYHGRGSFKTILISLKIWHSLVACVYQVFLNTTKFSNCVLLSTNKRVMPTMSCMLPQTATWDLPYRKIWLIIYLTSDSLTHTEFFFAALSVSPETVCSLGTTLACKTFVCK